MNAAPYVIGRDARYAVAAETEISAPNETLIFSEPPPPADPGAPRDDG